MKRFLFLLALGGGCALAFRVFLFENIVIASASMEPTLPVGQDYWINKAVYRFHAPQRGEIVVFPSPVEGKDLVKRVIAVGGDAVRLEQKDVVLNGQRQLEPYVQHTRADEVLIGDNLDLGVVPPGHLVVLGDNRDESGDSRDWVDAQGRRIPFVSVRALKGRLVR